MTEHATSLGHTPGDRWAFDGEVAHVFDDMLERSIPQYETMRGLVHQVGRGFVQPGTQVVDLGCSHGAALAPFVAEFGASASYVGIEVSQPMLDAARSRFRAELEAGTVDLEHLLALVRSGQHAASDYLEDALTTGVEVDSLEQLDAVLAEDVQLVLLDNFAVWETQIAAQRRDTRAPAVQLESSGGMSLENAAAYASTGVDYLAVGALTHSVRVLDIGLDM